MKKLITIFILVIMCLAAVSCNAEDEDSPFFPVQKAGLGQMEALLEGKLEMDDGYLRVKYFDDNYLLIWPYGFSLHTEGDEIQIIDRDGQIVARVGDIVTVGGGETTAEVVEKAIGRRLPDGCEGPYWLIGEFIEANSPSSESTSEKYAEIFEKYKDNPELIDAAIYAEEEGISVDEAVRRFELMDEAGPLQAAIVENEPDTYAGSWIQHQPEYRFVFAFTENGEEIIRKYVEEDSPLADKIKILTFKYSFRELQEIQEDITADMENRGIYPDSGIDMKNNCIDFSVTDKAAVDEAIRSGKLEIPDCVNVSQIEGLEIPYDGDSDYPELLTWSQWWAVSINGSDITGSRYISLYLSYDRRATGNAGCNYYQGRYVVKGSYIRFRGGIWSAMGCDEEILVQEDIYIDCLNNADTYSIEGDSMTIYDSSGQAILVFEKRPDYPMNPEDLIGTSWRLYQVDGEPVSENETGTIVFDEDGISIYGYDNVHTYEYIYEARGDDIVFTSMTGEGKRDDSGKLIRGRPSAISYLSPIISYRLTDGRLEMYTERKITLVFRPLENADSEINGKE